MKVRSYKRGRTDRFAPDPRSVAKEFTSRHAMPLRSASKGGKRRKRIQKHASDLYVIASSDSKTKKAIVDQAPKSLILAICDCAKNLLEGTTPVGKETLNRLRRYKRQLRQLGGSGTVSSKRALLKKGGNAAKALSALVRYSSPVSKKKKKKNKSSSSDSKLRQLVQTLVRKTSNAQ